MLLILEIVLLRYQYIHIHVYVCMYTLSSWYFQLLNVHFKRKRKISTRSRLYEIRVCMYVCLNKVAVSMKSLYPCGAYHEEAEDDDV